MNFDLSTIVGVLLTASTGAFIREVLIGIAKLRAGVAGTEHARRTDVVAQRDHALTEKAELERRLQAAERRADRFETYASDLREFCLAHGTPLNSLPPRPALQESA